MRLTPQDHALVSAAVTAAERQTDGEIVAMVAPQSDSYGDVALLWAVLAMLLVPAVLAAVPGHGVPLLSAVAGDWDAVWAPGTLLTLLLAAMALVLLGVRLLLAWQPLRMALTPRAVRAARVRARAVALFRAAIEARTASRTGVLVYLSLAEHQAEIVADEAIAARVAPEAWGDAMAALIDEVRAGRPGEGLAACVAATGTLLAQHFPHTGSDPQELPDRLIEL
ncbi:TPM domain-containing protein [Sphingomonas jatrophae]|uniref:Putative membrane protein n=1 Tax=Sphingomonas jatrophae TaxID=1166337 RepID=A0A1I6JLX3_9SPHN|nr:hypothetical protein [Sphingomonas jatrophae]SFR79937.1 putative membrane protein [Sphingomonas jatrophae]